MDNIDTAVINRFIDFYKGIPKGVVFDRYKSIKDILEFSGPKLSDSTPKKHFDEVSLFLNDCKAWFPKAVDGDILITIKGHKIRPSKKDKKKRPPYKDEELQKIFNPDVYAVKSSKHRIITSATFWLPLLGLFTGARSGELLQLEKHNIYKDKDAGIMVMSIKYFDAETKQENKGAKEETSERVVPLHNQLIKLKFLDYVKTIKSGRLFPDEEGESDRKFRDFSKRFSRYVKSVGVYSANENEQKAFHNFRHTVRSRLAEVKFKNSRMFDEWLIDAIVGHASTGRSVGQTEYTHTQLIGAKSKALDRLQYDFIEFDKLIRWDNCEFWRKKFRD